VLLWSAAVLIDGSLLLFNLTPYSLLVALLLMEVYRLSFISTTAA